MSVPDYTNKQGIRHADIVTCEGHWLKIQNPRTDTSLSKINMERLRSLGQN